MSMAVMNLLTEQQLLSCFVKPATGQEIFPQRKGSCKTLALECSMMAAWLVMLVWVSQMWVQAFPALKALNLTQQPSRAGALAFIHDLLLMWPGHVTALGMFSRSLNVIKYCNLCHAVLLKFHSFANSDVVTIASRLATYDRRVVIIVSSLPSTPYSRGKSNWHSGRQAECICEMCTCAI